jgi:hypothetical protein
MAKVICEAKFGGVPYAIPVSEEVWSPKLKERLKEIEEIMIPRIKAYEDAFPGNDEIWLSWDEDQLKNGNLHWVSIWSATISQPILSSVKTP